MANTQFVGTALLMLLLPAPSALGQSINIDFGQPDAGPSSTYGGAGRPGVWNSIEGQHTPFRDPQVIYDLVDVHGNPTGVTLHQFGGTDLIAAADPSVSGDDAILMNDALVTHTTNLESCLFINGLANGTYEVITYAWMPNNPFTLSRVRHDFTAGLVDVGGLWPGAHVEGVTYARHLVEVTTGFMGSHSGIVPLGNPVVGAALNGIQIRPFVACPNDVNGDGAVNVLDLVELLLCFGQPATPPCEAADVNGDASVNVLDLSDLLRAFGQACP